MPNRIFEYPVGKVEYTPSRPRTRKSRKVTFFLKNKKVLTFGTGVFFLRFHCESVYACVLVFGGTGIVMDGKKLFKRG